MARDDPFDFPCRFPIKAMGARGDAVAARALQIVRRHAPEVTPDDLRLRESRNGRYCSVTITIDARSRDQLDAIYRELSADEHILVVL